MRPELVSQLQARIGASGLTPDQLRARLRAAGFAESLLDPYLPGTSALATPLANDTLFAAVRSLGLADSTEVASLQALNRTLAPHDSVRPDTGLRVFGLEVFQRATSQFEPNLSGPVDDRYRLGPGDVLVLILTGDVELAHTLEVTREGFIVIPQVGQLYVSNLSLAELDQLLYTRLGRVYSGVRRGNGATTRFHVSVARLRSNQVFVVGDVAVPGSYRVSSAGSALTALYAAGGPNVNGSLRRIEIRRGGQVVDVLDLYDYLLRGDASHDVRLETGDVVFVPVHGPRVKIDGEVIRPAIYEIREGEGLPDLVRAAGGFTASASRRRVQIRRILPPDQRTEIGRDRVVIDLSAEQFEQGLSPSFALQPGDEVEVFPVVDRVRSRITVDGNVWAPGPQGYAPGMRLSDAIRRAGGVKPDVYLGQILVSRLQPDSTRIQLRSSFRDSTGSVSDDIVLREDDSIEIFSLSTFRPDRYVVVTGAVNAGGRFPYRAGMTLRDVVLMAGGLRESAYLGEAEIARLPESRENGVVATAFRVPLDSGYLFERSGNGSYLGPPGLPAPNGHTADVPLRPYDNVLILQQPEWQLQRTVFIGGEVRFPGQYALVTKTERLSGLLERAGGLTEEAYPDGVVFYRSEDRVGRVGIDLPRVLRGQSKQDDLILQHGDSIVIPEYNPVVKVYGSVNSPVGVAYVPGRSIEYYIAAAGGPSRDADHRRAYVRQPNGKVESARYRALLLPNSLPEPRAGAVIYVPAKDPNEKRDLGAVAGSVAQILASIVAIVAIALK